MAKRPNGATLDGKAQAILCKLRDAVGDGNDALLLHGYKRLCGLVGKDIADSSMDDKLREALKEAQHNIYRPEPATA